MKYKKYPSYKDSGVEWLGEIPEHWDIVRNKVAFQFVKSLVGEFSKNYKLLSLTLKGIILRDIESGKGKFPAEFNTYQKVEEKDLIFCLFDIDETPRTIGISKYDGMITGAYNVARCNRNTSDSKFMYYYYLSVDEYKGLKPFYTGLRKVVRTETFMNIELGLPPLQEQQQIATFLDNATQKMDTLIQKQENLIKLLKEKRQAVISHAVTRGLNPDVKFKDSGVEWLGDVPEHWEIKLVKYLLNDKVGIKIGPFGSALKLDDMVKDGYKVYGQENVIKRNFNLGHRFISQSKFESMIIYKIEPEDILITMMGTVGNCIVIPKDIKVGIIDSHLIKIRTNQELITSNYFVNMIDKSNIVKVQLDLFSKGSIMQGLNSSIIKSLIFPMPPVHEQAQILSYIDDKTSKIDTLIEKANKSITLLKEKRTALISAAVTGKIDVREQV